MPEQLSWDLSRRINCLDKVKKFFRMATVSKGPFLITIEMDMERIPTLTGESKKVSGKTINSTERAK